MLKRPQGRPNEAKPPGPFEPDDVGRSWQAEVKRRFREISVANPSLSIVAFGKQGSKITQAGFAADLIPDIVETDVQATEGFRQIQRENSLPNARAAKNDNSGHRLSPVGDQNSPAGDQGDAQPVREA